jgi:hypothetical protein
LDSRKLKKGECFEKNSGNPVYYACCCNPVDFLQQQLNHN